jgi:hypothetical protein
MATTLDTLVQRTRRFMRDYPVAQDALSASITSFATSATVSTGTQFNQTGNQVIEIDYEAILLKSVSANTLTVTRGYAGSTAATHASGATVLIRPAFLAVEIIDAINSTKDEMYPLVYKTAQDIWLTADGTTYEFTVPSIDSVPMQHIWKIDLKQTGDPAYRSVDYWEIRRGATPKIKFRFPPPSGTIRVHGYGPFPDLTASSSTVDALFPANCERPLITGVCARLLASSEVGQVRGDVGPRDDRDSARRAGASLSASNALYQRFQFQLRNAAMAPLPPHVVSVM